MTQERYLSPPQYARSVGVSTDKVLTLIRNRELKAVNFATSAAGRPRWRISPGAIREFEESRMVPGAKPPTPRRAKPINRDGIIEFY